MMFFVKDLVQITPKVNLQARVKCVYEHISPNFSQAISLVQSENDFSDRRLYY